MTKNICFDLRPLQVGHENRGIGMVIKSILNNLKDEDNNYLFYIFEDDNPLDRLKIKPLIGKYSLVTTPRLANEIKNPKDLIDIIKLQFHKFKPLKKYQPDVFIQFDFKLNIPNWKHTQKIAIAYDLIPLVMKNDYLPSPSFAFRNTVGKKAKIKSAIKSFFYLFRHKLPYRNYKKADKIISISQSTTDDFIKLLKIEKTKITTIPLAPANSNNTKDKELSKIDQIKKPYILYIGGTDSRKKVDHVIFAYNIVRSRGYDIKLLLVGNEFKDNKTIPDNKTRDAIYNSPYNKDILCLGFVDDEEKDSLYVNAHAFVLCSEYEGFGLPLIEAMQNQCPVVAYKNSSISETVGDAALLVETGNFVEVAKKVIELFDENKKMYCLNKGLGRAKKFSWNRFLHNLMKVLNDK